MKATSEKPARKFVAGGITLLLAIGLGLFSARPAAAGGGGDCTPGEGMDACAWSAVCEEECVVFDCTIENCVQIQRLEESCIKCMDIWED